MQNLRVTSRKPRRGTQNQRVTRALAAGGEGDTLVRENATPQGPWPACLPPPRHSSALLAA
eukprot:3428306-Pyramimonas_sp.AAC.1